MEWDEAVLWEGDIKELITMVYATQKDNILIEHELNIHPSFIKSTYTVYKRQLLRLVSSKMQIIFMLLMPILFLAVIGQAFKNFLPNGVQGMDYLTFMTPGVLIMVTLFSGIFGGISLFYDRDSGYLKNYLIAPSPRTAIVTGYALGTGTRVVIQVAVLLGLAVLLGAKLNLTIFNVLIIFVFALLTTNFLMGLSITLAAKAPNVEVFQQVIMPIVMPLQFLAPVMYTTDALPSYFQPIAKINPITFGIDGIRGTLFKPSIAKYLTTPIINTPLITNNLVLFDLLFLLIIGTFFLYIGARLFLKSLAG